MVSSSETIGGLLLQSPSLHDYDKREMFYFYLYPRTRMSNKCGSRRSVAPIKAEFVAVLVAGKLEPDEGGSTCVMMSIFTYERWITSYFDKESFQPFDIPMLYKFNCAVIFYDCSAYILHLSKKLSVPVS